MKRKTSAERICTAIVTEGAELLRDLWPNSVSVLHASQSRCGGDNSRTLEVFFDCLAALSIESQLPLLDPRFESTLSTESKEVKDFLLPIVNRAMKDPALRNASKYPEFLNLLKTLGYFNHRAIRSKKGLRRKVYSIILKEISADSATS
jgi:hypothetical protein